MVDGFTIVATAAITVVVFLPDVTTAAAFHRFRFVVTGRKSAAVNGHDFRAAAIVAAVTKPDCAVLTFVNIAVMKNRLDSLS